MKNTLLHRAESANNDTGYIVEIHRIDKKIIKFVYEAGSHVNDRFTVYIFNGSGWDYFLGNYDLDVPIKSSYLLTAEQKITKANRAIRNALPLVKDLLS